MEYPQNANIIATQPIRDAVWSTDHLSDVASLLVRNTSAGLRKGGEPLNDGYEPDNDPRGRIGAIFGDEVVDRADIPHGSWGPSYLSHDLICSRTSS